MRNISLEVNHSSRMEILEKACTKMKTSGHRERFIRQAAVRGITAFKENIEEKPTGRKPPRIPTTIPEGWMEKG